MSSRLDEVFKASLELRNKLIIETRRLAGNVGKAIFEEMSAREQLKSYNNGKKGENGRTIDFVKFINAQEKVKKAKRSYYSKKWNSNTERAALFEKHAIKPKRRHSM